MVLLLAGLNWGGVRLHLFLELYRSAVLKNVYRYCTRGTADTSSAP